MKIGNVMFRFNISRYKFIVLILLYLLPTPHVSFSEECCTTEQNALQQAQQQMENADAARDSARNELSAAGEAEAVAGSDAASAIVAYDAAFLEVQQYPENFAKQYALEEATVALLQANDNWNEAKGKRVQAENVFLEACAIYGQAKGAYDSANQSLQECLEKVDPGPCQKCENGAVVSASGPCDDFDPCTENDYCTDGGCAGTPIENPSPDSPECL
jgi:hypothetical protein